MRSFKKVLASAFCFICIMVLVSTILIQPYLTSEAAYYEDAKLRDDLSGSLDFLITGASHGIAGFVPQILDDELECNSYNLSGSMMTLYARRYLLEKELKRNPVKTVVIELSFDTLLRDQSNEYAIGDEPTLTRLDSNGERLSYLIKYVHTEDWLNIYSRQLVMGLSNWKEILHGDTESKVNYSLKGFHSVATSDITLSKDEAYLNYNSQDVSTDYRTDNLEQFYSLIKLCKDYDARITVVVVPLSDGMIWEYDGWDAFNNWVTVFCKKQDCELYDLNLLKNRYELFNDKNSFYDDDHLSNSGAAVFTTEFCKLIKLHDNREDMSDLFYNSYNEMKQDSPYMKYLVK